MRKLGRSLAFIALPAVLVSPAIAQVSINIQPNRPEKPVVGLPYTADQTVHTVQHLGNGMVVTRTVTGRICRSADGLERYEGVISSTDPAQPSTTLVYILDRTKRTATLLNSRLKTATVEHLPENATISIRFLPPQRTPGAPSSGVIKPQDIASTDLGHRKEGLHDLVGRRITTMIPAGRIGNDQPLPIIVDEWIYPELKLIVQEDTNDPISGERTFELTNIRGEEPDPELFQVPEDYTVKERASQPALPAGLMGMSGLPVVRTPQIDDALAGADPGLKNSVAYALANNNDHLADAETLARQAVGIVEQNAANAFAGADPPHIFASMSALSSFWDTLAGVYFREGNQKQAEAFARAAFELKPNPEYCSHLGRIYEAEGRKQDAIAIYQMALSKKNSPAALDFFQTRVAQLGSPGAPVIPMAVITPLALDPPLAPETDTLLDVTLSRDQQPAVSYLKVHPRNESAVTAAIQSALAADLPANGLPDNGPEIILRRARLLCASDNTPACSLSFISSEELKPPPPAAPTLTP